MFERKNDNKILKNGFIITVLIKVMCLRSSSVSEGHMNESFKMFLPTPVCQKIF